MSRNQVYFDLTEAQLSASTRRIQYYGIARTVIESAKSAASLNPDIRFVVYSFGYNAFYEVPWKKELDGTITFELPQDLGQRWHRTHYGYSKIISALTSAFGILLAARNRRLWDQNSGVLKRIDILSGIIFSAARPKLIVDMIKTLQRQGSNAKFVPLLHDFMPLHPGATKRFRQFDRNFLFDNRFVISHSAGVITNSVFTQHELERFTEAKMLPQAKRIDPVPLVHECPEGIEKQEIVLPNSPYLLTVGLHLGRKNIEVVLEALRRMRASNSNIPKLIVAGARRKRLIRYVDKPEFASIRDSIIFINNPNQTDLIRLYTNAIALVIPSRIEGWGLPAGEALWCGTPAICSTTPVLREVCGDLGLYFDPDNPDQLVKIIQMLLEDTEFTTGLRLEIAKSKRNLRTWNNVATDIIDVLSKY